MSALSSISMNPNHCCHLPICGKPLTRKNPFHVPIFFCCHTHQLIHLFSSDFPKYVETDHKASRVFSSTFPKPDSKQPVASNSFTFEEITDLLESHLYTSTRADRESAVDPWEEVTKNRQKLAPASQTVIYETIQKFCPPGAPVLEIGAAASYKFQPNQFAPLNAEPFRQLEERTISTQSNEDACALFSCKSKKPIYQLDIAEIHHLLAPAKKRVPVVFAVNAWDKMTYRTKRENALLLSQLQGPGDKIIVIQDATPSPFVLTQSLFWKYPKYACLPYFPSDVMYSPLSFLLVPISKMPASLYDVGVPRKLCCQSLKGLLEREMLGRLNKSDTLLQIELRILQKKEDLVVLSAQDVFAKEMTQVFTERGYSVEQSHHRSFFETNRSSHSPQRLVYQSPWALPNAIEWDPDDMRFDPIRKSFKQTENLNLPPECLVNNPNTRVYGATAFFMVATKK